MTSITAVNPILSESKLRELDTAKPMWKIVLEQFLEHRMAVLGTIIIGLFILTALSAPLISNITGLDPNKQNVNNRYLMPLSRAELSSDLKETQIEKWISAEENKSFKDILSQSLIEQGLLQSKPEDVLFDLGMKSQKEAIDLLQKVQINQSQSLSLGVQSFHKLIDSFSSFHPFGTDEIGRDVFIRLVYGARVSMGVGVLVAIASALVGLLIGSLAGFYGGVIDTFLMRITDALLSLPLMPVLIVISAIDLQKLPTLKALMNPENESIVKMFVILCLFSWMTVARLVRGSILSLREREFVLAARTLGAKDSYIILRHMFPNVMAPMLVSITLGVGESILFEAALSFLGLGIMPPTASWGNMLTNAQEVIYKNAWLTVLPGIMIFLTTVSFNFIGDGLQDAMDPKAVRR